MRTAWKLMWGGASVLGLSFGLSSKLLELWQPEPVGMDEEEDLSLQGEWLTREEFLSLSSDEQDRYEQWVEEMYAREEWITYSDTDVDTPSAESE